MDEAVVDHLGNIIGSTTNIEGVVATDNAGLCIEVRGATNERAGAYLASIVSRSRDLHPEALSPVVSIESSTKVILSSESGGIIVSTYRSI